MPDADGKFRGAFFRAESWTRVFAPNPPCPQTECPGSNPCEKCNPVVITWEPEWDLDGAVFTPECDCRDRCADPKRDDCRNPKT